jgi:hypothetical protein
MTSADRRFIAQPLLRQLLSWQASALQAGSTELHAYHETLSPRDLATLALVRARKFKLKLGPNERWILDLDFRAAWGDVQYRTSPGREGAVDCYPRFLFGRSAGRTRFSSE